MWCIGNHGVYRSGPFQQYVHMIEIAANGALQEELALVRERGARLHVIRPRVPLPLDPDFFFGRIDASTLIAMGYRDAAAYLDGPRESAADAAATRMADPVPGVAVRERAVREGLALRLTWEVDDLEAFEREPRGTVVGDVTHPELGERRLIRSGRFRVEGGVTEATLDVGGRTLALRRRDRALEASLDGGPPQTLMSRSTPWDLHVRGVAGLREAARARARWLRSAR